MVAFAELKTSALELYNDTEARPKKVQELLVSVGADKVLSRVVCEAKAEKVVAELSALSTLAGLSAKKTELSELAAPYIEKAGSADGRKELLSEGKELAAPYVTPYVEKVQEKINAGKEFAAPYLSSVKESSAPYMAKLEELRRSERVEAMVLAFQEAREHPAEKVGELRAKAVDLIKYENIKAYRDHVLSAEFQADTARLVKVELPAIASSAAKRGAETIKSSAIALAEEIEGHKDKVKSLVSQGYEMASQVEVEVLREKIKTTSNALLAELQLELSLGVEHAKVEGLSLSDIVERIKRIGTAIDKMVITPIKLELTKKEGEECACDAKPATEAPAEQPTAAEDTEDDELHDAQEITGA